MGLKTVSGRLLICGFGAFPHMPDNPSALVVERLAAASWSAGAAPTAYAVLPTTWGGSTELLRRLLEETRADGVLLTGVAGSAQAFRVEMRAANLCSTIAPDAEGALRTDSRITPLGPAALRTTAPVQAMLAAVRAEGLPAEASSDAGDYLCNFALYSLLSNRLDASGPFGFLHIPPASSRLGLDDLERGVKAAAGAMARALAFLPASRLNG